jgi:hypothetical protein
MIAASRRSSNELPRQAWRSLESSTQVKHGTGLPVCFGGRSRAIGSGISSSAASHRKNRRSPWNWLRA